MRAAILAEALQLVPQYGWTRMALEEACAKLDLPRTVHGLFPGGEVDLIAHYVEQCNSQLAGAVEWDASTPMRDRLKQACRRRLEMVLPYQDSWGDALRTLASPWNVMRGARLLHETSDEILHVSGDESTDLGWYSKRGGLSAVYAASELHLLSDMNPEKPDTWAFLDNRLDNYAGAIQACSQVSKLKH